VRDHLKIVIIMFTDSSYGQNNYSKFGEIWEFSSSVNKMKNKIKSSRMQSKNCRKMDDP